MLVDGISHELDLNHHKSVIIWLQLTLCLLSIDVARLKWNMSACSLGHH